MRPDPDIQFPTADDAPSPALDRMTAVVIAGYRNDPAGIVAGLGDVDANVRAAALGALVRSTSIPDDEVSRAWTAAMADVDPIVRRRGVLAAPQLGVISSAALLEALSDLDDRVVEAACFAAGEIEPADPTLITQLALVIETHQDSLCREAAVAALGSLGVPEGLQGVLRGCEDKATVRRRAVLALANYDTPEVTDMLRRMTSDRDLQVRQSAEDLLAISEGHDIGSDESGPNESESTESESTDVTN